MTTPVARSACGYIDGVWVTGDGGPFDVVNPSTEDTLATVPSMTVAQADRAVAAARRAFDGGEWSRVPAAERARLLHRLADLMERDADRLVQLIVDEIGTPCSNARRGQLPYPIRNLHWYADAATELASGGQPWLPPTTGGPGISTRMTRQPIGVVLGLAAYNYPLNLAVWKLGGALAAGCSIVLVCSQKAVLTTTALARLIDEAGFPAGAFHLVYGPPPVAEHLCRHPDVDFVTFTGSAAIGKRIVELAAPTLKKVVLELGGKSANIILPGTDVAGVAAACQRGWMSSAGQGCSALTRTLVPRADHDRYLEHAVAAAEAMGCGDPNDPATVAGPLVSAGQRASVMGYVDRARADGATIATGGRIPDRFPRGFFYEPTIVVGVDNRAEIAQEELFGPVSVVLPYDDVDHAIALANDSRYGLFANVWGRTDEALGVAERLRTGTVAINGGGPMLPDHPWGGFKESGLGREGGWVGFGEFFEVKHYLWPVDEPAAVTGG